MVLEFVTEEENPQEVVEPTLGNVITNAIDRKTEDLRVAMPAEIVDYDVEKQLATVKPLLKTKYRDGKVVDMPQIFNVPVAHPRAGDAYVHMPVKKGNTCMVVFSDRSMDKWITNGGSVDPDDVRQHHLSDAIAYPGLYSQAENMQVANGDDLILMNKSGEAKMEIRLKKNNHLEIYNNGNELLNVLNEMLKIIREAKVYTSSGPQQLRHAKFIEIARKLKSFEEA